MKTFRSNFDYINVLSHIALFVCFTVFNCLEQEVLPYSTAIYVTALSLGCSIIISSLSYLASFLFLSNPGLLGAGFICAVVFTIVTLIYKKCNIKMRFEAVAFTIIGLTGFIFLGNTANQIITEKRILCVLLTALLTFLTMITGKAVSEKGLKFKLNFEEVASIAVVTSLFGLGLCNYFTPLLWKSLSIVIILAVCYIYRVGISAIVSVVLGITLSIYYKNLEYVAIFLVWSVCAECFSSLSRYASAIAVILADYLMQVVFSVYPDYQMAEFISVIIGVAIFCIIPTILLKNLKEKLYSFREKQLTREAINRNRTMLSGRLYDLSSVFLEMAQAFNVFKENNLSESTAKEIMEKQILNSVCKDCSCFMQCKKCEKQVKSGLNKMIDIGFAKGKLSLIDLPKELGEVCIHPNNILYGLNKLLAEYREKLIATANVSSGRELLASEALGIAEILRGLALDTGTLLKYQSRLERHLSDCLFKSGFNVNELLVYGENERLSVSVITAMKEFSMSEMQSVISKALNMQMEICERAKITEEKFYISFKKATEFDAVFGIAKAKKDGSDTSGDTHSVMRINGDKFMFALSDGMGSGQRAQNISSASLSLIESFYKAGLNGSLILSTVNKLLAINTEDSFTALDVSVIDLKTCTADFIKYGSPYGFIINDNGIKIIEGNALPLGIIDELKPSVATTQLEGGDMVLLLTDGISDAFGSSGDIIDFLRTVPAKNPQTLADEILNYAVMLSNGQKKDDMTALAVRVFKRAI